MISVYGRLKASKKNRGAVSQTAFLPSVSPTEGFLSLWLSIITMSIITDLDEFFEENLSANWQSSLHKKSEDFTTPSTYRGLKCKNLKSTDTWQKLNAQKSSDESIADTLEDIKKTRERKNNWHKRWYGHLGDDGIWYAGYESMPFVEVRRGFSYWLHGYRATKKEVMTDSDFFKLFDAIKRRYAGTFSLQPTATKNGIMWERWYRNENGVSLYCNRKAESPSDMPEHHIMIVVDGSHCEIKPFDKVCYDVVWLYDTHKFNMTRVDPKVRDCECRITLEQIEFWRNHGHVRGVRKWQRDCGEVTTARYGSFVMSSDRTKYLGKRSGNKLVRVYEPHKLHHSCGLDWECEYKGDRANDFAQKLSDCVDRCHHDENIPFQLINEFVAREFTKVIADSVLSAVSFVERNGKMRDYDMLPEWQQFIDDIMSDIANTPIFEYHPTKLKSSKRETPNISKKIDWLFKQVAPTLAACAETFDDDGSRENFVQALISNGMDRIDGYLKSLSKQGFDTPPDISGELRRLEIMEMLPAI